MYCVYLFAPITNMQFNYVLFYAASIVRSQPNLKLASKCSPSFANELKDERAALGEKVKFHCKFAGTPIPGKPNPPKPYLYLSLYL